MAAAAPKRAASFSSPISLPVFREGGGAAPARRHGVGIAYGAAVASPSPQSKSAVADFDRFIEWPKPAYTRFRLGEGRGGGSGGCGNAMPPLTTPTPDPSPQGGGEEFAAPPRREAADAPAPRLAASSPASKPRKLASADFPARIAPSNAPAGIGSRPDAAMAPNITALIMASAPLATTSMSNSTCTLAFFTTDAINFAASKRPSPIAIFSAMPWERWVLAIIRVR